MKLPRLCSRPTRRPLPPQARVWTGRLAVASAVALVAAAANGAAGEGEPAAGSGTELHAPATPATPATPAPRTLRAAIESALAAVFQGKGPRTNEASSGADTALDTSFTAEAGATPPRPAAATTAGAEWGDTPPAPASPPVPAVNWDTGSALQEVVDDGRPAELPPPPSPPLPMPSLLPSEAVMPRASPAAPTLPAAAAVAATEGARVPRIQALPALLQLPAVLPMARAAPPTAALSLSDATAQGLDHSMDVQAARYRLESFIESGHAARGALLPRADVRWSAGRGRLDSVEPSLSLPRSETTATVRQAVIDEPARIEWGRQALLAHSARLQLASAESQALMDTANAYLAVLQSRIGLALGEDYETRLAELLRYVGERAAAGGTSGAERERVAARVANARAQLADTRAALQAALRNLNRLTGGVPAALDLAAPVLLALPADDDAMPLAQQRNSELLAAQTEQAAAEAEGRGHRSRSLPRLELELSHSSSHNAAGTQAVFRDTKAMAVITLDVLNGGADQARLRAAQAHGSELAARVEGVKRRLLQEIETAYANLQASRERFSAVGDELQGNERVVAAFRMQLSGGTRALLDVLDAYQRLHQSRLDVVQVVVSVAQNEWRIAHLTGVLREPPVQPPLPGRWPFEWLR